MAVRNKTVYGLSGLVSVGINNPTVTTATSAPTTSTKGDLGDIYINTSSGISYMLVQITGGSFVWALLSAGSGDVDTLSGDAGTATPVLGDIQIKGGTNVTTAGAGKIITVNLDAAVTLATSITSPIYTCAGAMAINCAAGNDITMKLGDAAAANKLSIVDSASAEVASIDSDGKATFVKMDGIIGSVTPAAGTFTTATASTSVVAPLHTSGAGVDIKVEAVAGQNIILNMSDNAGVQKVSFTDSDDAEVFSVDSNGNLPTIAGALTVTGLITGNGSATINTGGTALNLGTDNSGDAVNIGNGNVARAISIGTVAAAHTVNIGNASAGAIAVDTAAGISLDAATASNFTVTGAADLAVQSTAGGVNISSGEAATATGITLDATAADGGVTIDAGTSGINIGTTVGCTAVSIGDIAPTASRTITVGGGTVITAAVTDTIDIGPDGATTNANSIKTVNVNTGGVALGQVLTNIGSGTITSGTHTVSIQTGNAAAGTVATNISTGTGTKSVSIGNADANTTINLDGILAINNNVNGAVTINDGTSTGAVTIGNIANTGAIALASASTVDLDAAGAISINSTGAALNIGNDADAFAINIGTGGAARTITVGNGTGATSLVFDCGTGALNIGTNAIAHTTTIGNNTGASSVVVNVGTGAASFGATATDHTTTIGSTTGAAPLVLQAGTGEITMTGTVKQLDAEFVTRSGVEVTFQSSPILQSTATTGAAPTGATGDTNLMLFQEGIVLEEFIKGAGQTIIAPRMDSTGLLISLDQVATEGVEINGGAALTTDKLSFVIGTAAAFYAECTFTIADVSGCEPLYFGFRKTQANAADYTTYTDFVGYGVNNLVAGGDCVIATNLNGAGINTTDTNDAWADAGTHTLQVLVSAAGVVTFTFDGGAPTVTQAFTFDNGDRVHFWYTHVFGAGAPGNIHWVDFKCGFQA